MERKNKKIVAGMMAGFCVLSTQTLVQYGLLLGNGGIATKNSSSLQAFGTSGENAFEEMNELENKFDNLKIEEDDDDDDENESDASREKNEEIVEVEKKLDDSNIEDDDDDVGILDENNICNGCKYGLVDGEAILLKVIDSDDVKEVIIPAYVKKGDKKYRVTGIRNLAISCCWDLTTIFISKFVTSINDNILFYSDMVETINIDPDNPSYKSIDGNVYSKDGKTLILMAPAKELTPDHFMRLEIRADVKKINNNFKVGEMMSTKKIKLKLVQSTDKVILPTDIV